MELGPLWSPACPVIMVASPKESAPEPVYNMATTSESPAVMNDALEARKAVPRQQRLMSCVADLPQMLCSSLLCLFLDYPLACDFALLLLSGLLTCVYGL